MDFMRDEATLNAVVPGVTEAYAKLRSTNGQGIYTSLGRFYNHTIFGRDAGMAAKFVSNFDHEMVWQTILTLASYQGQKNEAKTQEQLGRIHHELRDYAAWESRWYDYFGLWWAGRMWGMKNKQLLSYFAADTTATYIRLVHKYASNIDASILERQVPQKDGTVITLAVSLERAANWILHQVNDDGLFVVHRTNRWSLPYQTFADSVSAYAWQDGRPADSTKPHGFIEVQAYALDALQDAARMLPGSAHAHRWRKAAEAMHVALFNYFWRSDVKSFAPAVFSRGGEVRPLDTEMITAGWALNTSFWEHMSGDEHHDRIAEIVTRLFQDDFLTDVGLRTRSATTNEPLGSTIDYHGSHTVWPMFTFMVIEGLRRHGLYRLARELENRTLNGVNAIGNFPEFFIVDSDGRLYKPNKAADYSLRGQMIPEQNIGFTVVPALTLAYRHSYKRHNPATKGWQHELEEHVLSSIHHVDLLHAAEATERLSPISLRINRSLAGLQSAWHIAPVILKKP